MVQAAFQGSHSDVECEGFDVIERFPVPDSRFPVDNLNSELESEP